MFITFDSFGRGRRLSMMASSASSSRFASGLNRGHQQREQQADNGQHHQQFDERQTGS